MSYTKVGSAHSTHNYTDTNGNQVSGYSRYETGIIEGEYRDMLALIADETGFDGLGFDTEAGSNDDKWHVVNMFENGGRYVDSVAIAGALNADHAKTLAATQFDHLGADYGVVVGYLDDMQFDHMTDDEAWSVDAINKLLDNPSQDKHYLPVITSKELYTESMRASQNDVQWDNLNLVSHGGSISALHSDMLRADTFKELTQEFDLTEALAGMQAEEAEFDSIMDTVNRLPMMKDRLFRAMSQASNDQLSVTNVTQTKPFKRGGVVNIAFVFDLSDGQKLSIWFHNPDSTPSKLLASDMMVSWKWLLNKRDVTAILSPVNGKEVKIPTLAKQMMMLAAKNSKTFKRAQERKAKKDAEIKKVKSEIEQKEKINEQLDADIESLNKRIDEAMKANKGKADKDTTSNDNEDAAGKPTIKVRDALDYFNKNYLDNDTDNLVIATKESEFSTDVSNIKTYKQTAKAAISRYQNEVDQENQANGTRRKVIILTPVEDNLSAAYALQDLGHEIDFKDPDDFLPDWFSDGMSLSVKRKYLHGSDTPNAEELNQYTVKQVKKDKGLAEPEFKIASANGAWAKNILLSELVELHKASKDDVASNSEADTANLTPITRDTVKTDDEVIWINDNGRVEGIYRGYANDNEVVIVVGTGMQMTAPAKDVYFKNPPKPKNNTAANGMRYEDISTKNQTMIKIFKGDVGEDHFKLLASKDGSFRVTENDETSIVKSTYFKNINELLAEHPYFEDVLSEFGISAETKGSDAKQSPTANDENTPMQSEDNTDNTSEEVEAFVESATGDGWKLDISTASSDIQSLHKKVNGVDLLMKVSDEGFDVHTPDEEEEIFFSEDGLEVYEAAKQMIEQGVKDYIADKSDDDEPFATEPSKAYSQDDIAYLESIINGEINHDDVDMDRVIAIGEKDEDDPLFSQALEVVLEAVDKASANL